MGRSGDISSWAWEWCTSVSQWRGLSPAHCGTERGRRGGREGEEGRQGGGRGEAGRGRRGGREEGEEGRQGGVREDANKEIKRRKRTRR